MSPPAERLRAQGPRLYIVALIVAVIIVWNLRNAWFLLMGVADEYLVEPR